MICEHGNKIKIVQKMRSPRMQDGCDVIIEGCEECEEIGVESEIR